MSVLQTMAHYNVPTEIEAVVQGFENCTTAKEAFTHREHLTVAVWYLYHSPEAQALENMRTGLQRFLDHHRVSTGKYKEALTVSWMNLISETIRELDSSRGLLEVTNGVIDRLFDSSIISVESKTSG